MSWFVARIAPERDTVVFRLQNAAVDVQVHLFALVYAVLVVLLVERTIGFMRAVGR